MPETTSRVLFGTEDARGGATYLIWWPDGAEPMACAFYGGGLDTFADLNRYLELLLGERTHDNSAKLLATSGAHVWPVATREGPGAPHI